LFVCLFVDLFSAILIESGGKVSIEAIY
jgi:hypothetical protein